MLIDYSYIISCLNINSNLFSLTLFSIILNTFESKYYKFWITYTAIQKFGVSKILLKCIYLGQ